MFLRKVFFSHTYLGYFSLKLNYCRNKIKKFIPKPQASTFLENSNCLNSGRLESMPPRTGPSAPPGAPPEPSLGQNQKYCMVRKGLPPGRHFCLGLLANYSAGRDCS
jgi:hypothetical protein